MANSVDPDEMAHYELSQLDLHCLHRYLFWSAGLKGLMYCIINTVTSSGLFHHNSLDQAISNSRVSGYFLLLLCFIEIPVTDANNVDPNHSVASDLSLHCLPISVLGVSLTKMD